MTWDAMQQSAAEQSALDCSSLSVRCVGSSLSTAADGEDEALPEADREPEPEAAAAGGGQQLGLVGTLQWETADWGWWPTFEDVRDVIKVWRGKGHAQRRGHHGDEQHVHRKNVRHVAAPEQSVGVNVEEALCLGPKSGS